MVVQLAMLPVLIEVLQWFLAAVVHPALSNVLAVLSVVTLSTLIADVVGMDLLVEVAAAVTVMSDSAVVVMSVETTSVANSTGPIAPFLPTRY